MEPADLKRQFGDKLTFWGGAIDAQHVLPHGTPEQIRNDVRKNLQAFKPSGGYVFNNVHNIQAGVPPENILALYDAAYEFGRYS
jgi:uroporphyrinogen decarboxylase